MENKGKVYVRIRNCEIVNYNELVSFRLLRDGFSELNITRIPRTRNLRADSLAKEARCSGTLFPHIDQTQPDRASLQNDSEPPTT